jgi:hypothetical protein
VNAWVTADNEPSFAAADTRRYKAEGFVAAASEQTTPNSGGDGIANVIEFATSAGAQHELAYLIQSTGGTTFSVAGIPGATGEEGQQAGGSAADLNWAQGRCTLDVGEAVPSSTAATEPLIAAARAVYRRTGGTCP